MVKRWQIEQNFALRGIVKSGELLAHLFTNSLPYGAHSNYKYVQIVGEFALLLRAGKKLPSALVTLYPQFVGFSYFHFIIFCCVNS